ncbi:MAG: PEP-CTERM sorting domain-containing protein [Thiobacillaceae bacterium]
MPTWLLKSAALAGLSLLAYSAQADVLPATNLTFTDYTGSTPKDYFTNVKPVGWTFGNGGNLIFIDAPGTADNGSYLSVYGPFPTNSPVGGNFVEADGNPDYESVFYEQITGLNPGQTYSLSFYQAAGQQQGFGNGNSTTEQWVVSLGTSALVDTVVGSNGLYSNPDAGASTVITPMMTTPSGGVTPWQYVTVNLTADSTTDLLSFLAWGDGGSTVNLPPIVFLSGVNQPDVIPEPATLALFGLGLLGLGASRMRLRPRNNSLA